MKSYQQEFDYNFNKTVDINDNCDNDINKNNYDKQIDLASQTYSGPFHQNDSNNVIKVNIIDNNINNTNINSYNEVVNSSKKSANNKNKNFINIYININKGVVNSGLKKNIKKSLYIETNFKVKSKRKKLLPNKKSTEPNIKLKNEKKIIKDNFSYKSQIASVNHSKDCQNNKNSSKNLYTNNNSTSMDAKVFPLSKDNNNKAYIKKNVNTYFNGNIKNFKSISNRNSLAEKKIFSPRCCYNTQRIKNNNLIGDVNNIYFNNNDNFNSAKSYKIQSRFSNDQKMTKMLDYRYKLEKIKSRVLNLLGVYSLLALKTININENENKNV